VINDEVNKTQYHCLYGRDYTASLVATSGGNKYLKITFVNNFEAFHAGLTVLDPTVHDVGYRVKPDTTSAGHGAAIKNILEKAGITTAAASYTAADAALVSKVNFSMPTYLEQDYKEYYKYIEDILSSSLGYIYIDGDLKIAYNVFDTPSSTDEVTPTDILDGTTTIRVEYQDIIDHLIAYNDHIVDAEVNTNSSKTASSTRAKYLHGINKTTRFIHVLEDISSRITDILNVRSNRFVYYTFKTKSKNLDTVIGDEFLLNRDGLLGNVATQSVVAIGVSKNNKNVSIEATDLYNI
jgi:hypothetical protein